MVDLGLVSFLKSSGRLLRLAKKPDRSELWLSIKICLLGIIAIGLIGFVIKLLAGFVVSSFPVPSSAPALTFWINNGGA